MRAVKAVVVDEPTREHEGKSRDKLLVRKCEDEAI